MIRLVELRDEALLVYSERRDSLEQQWRALSLKDRRATFTAAEVAKRAARLPRLSALAQGMQALIERRDELPTWVLRAFEEASE